jgi:hypothetical protein
VVPVCLVSSVNSITRRHGHAYTLARRHSERTCRTTTRENESQCRHAHTPPSTTSAVSSSTGAHHEQPTPNPTTITEPIRNSG